MREPLSLMGTVVPIRWWPLEQERAPQNQEVRGEEKTGRTEDTMNVLLNRYIYILNNNHVFFRSHMCEYYILNQ